MRPFLRHGLLVPATTAHTNERGHDGAGAATAAGDGCRIRRSAARHSPRSSRCAQHVPDSSFKTAGCSRLARRRRSFWRLMVSSCSKRSNSTRRSRTKVSSRSTCRARQSRSRAARRDHRCGGSARGAARGHPQPREAADRVTTRRLPARPPQKSTKRCSWLHRSVRLGAQPWRSRCWVPPRNVSDSSSAACAGERAMPRLFSIRSTASAVNALESQPGARSERSTPARW